MRRKRVKDDVTMQLRRTAKVLSSSRGGGGCLPHLEWVHTKLYPLFDAAQLHFLVVNCSQNTLAAN